ncbi:MAG: hypothetical protein ACRDT2_01535 [Natronosporangium sp.]
MPSMIEVEFLGRLNEVIGRVSAESASLTVAVNRGIGWLPPGVQHATRRSWDEFVQALERLWDELREIISQLGSPSTLEAVALSWSEQVSGPVSALVGRVGVEVTHVDRYWEGDAAEAYLDSLPAKRTAIASLRTTYGEPAGSALAAMAGAIITFWVCLVAALITLAGGLVAAVSASGTIVGIPVGVPIAVIAVLGCAAAVVGGWAQLRAQASNQNNTLVQRLNDNSALPDESWPQSTVGSA